MLGARGIGGDERQVDFGFAGRRKLDFGFFAGFLQALQRELVVAQVDPLLLFKLVGQVVDDAKVEVLAAEERVAVGGFNLEHAIADFEDRNVEGTAAEIVHDDGAGTLLVHAVSQRRGGWLVDDTQHVQAGDAAGVLGRLALAVVEVRGDGDHGLGDGFAKIGFRRLFHLAEHEGTDLARGVFLAAALYPCVAVVAFDDFVGHHALVFRDQRIVVAPAHQALDRIQRVGRVRDGLPLGGLADEAFAIVGEGNHAGRGARAFRVLDDPDFAAFHNGDARVRGAEVDTDYLTHVSKAPFSGRRRPEAPRTPLGGNGLDV